MKAWVMFLVMLATTAVLRAGDNETRVYQVQLVRGTNNERPEDPKWKPAAAKVSDRLSPFRWKHYWEVDQQVVQVSNRKSARTTLPADRAVEVQLISPGVSEIRLYRKGELVRKSRQPAQAKVTIMGGDREQDRTQSWFVVVRNTQAK